jgi:hypothetical protein
MSDPYWVSLAEAVQNWATAIGIIIGGAWVYYRFGLTRAKETALALDLTYTCTPYKGGNTLVFFDVTLTNTGVVRLTAKRNPPPVYKDKCETLQYSGDLLVRRISDDIQPGTQVRWFPQPPSVSFSNNIELNLLQEYEISDGKADFWMEPGESYHLGTAIVLSSGTYIAMVTFLGSGAYNREFWRRSFLVQI